jgi:murein DD-endopeptidase MepM/ murein hydrolase activator NlpD
MMACTLSDLPDEPPKATELPCDPEEIARISNRFGSWTDDSGKQQFHGGIDFCPYQGKTATFYAIADGTVATVNTDTKLGLDGDKGAINYRIEIAISKHVNVGYHFEVGVNKITGQPITPEEVNANIRVKEGQAVKAGDPIGIIPYYEDGSHVHFSIQDEKYGGETPGMPSPLTYFEPSVAEKLEAMNVLW